MTTTKRFAALSALALVLALLAGGGALAQGVDWGDTEGVERPEAVKFFPVPAGLLPAPVEDSGYSITLLDADFEVVEPGVGEEEQATGETPTSYVVQYPQLLPEDLLESVEEGDAEVANRLTSLVTSRLTRRIRDMDSATYEGSFIDTFLASAWLAQYIGGLRLPFPIEPYRGL